MTQTQEQKSPAHGKVSFCIPRAAIDALLNNQATVYEICAYLVLARYTDQTGRYSSASLHAVNRYTGANKTKGGPVDRAINRLKTIKTKVMGMVSNGRNGKSHAMVAGFVDGSPILYDRDTWHRESGEILPDGPTERGKVLYVLPDFNEQLEDRVWFGGSLVNGFATFNQPLKTLKNAGDVAARLLLSMYASNDMETWGGVCPIGSNSGPWSRYEPVSEDINVLGKARLLRAKSAGLIGVISKKITGTDKPEKNEIYFTALSALESSGFIYEVVLALNRNSVKKQFSSGMNYNSIPEDAEPYYELDTRSKHGYKPEGEEGVGGVTANTAGALGHPVAIEGGKLDGTYAAFVPTSFGTMIVGIYRLRFRVSNLKNAGVSGTWAGIHQRNQEALELVQRVRVANKLPSVQSPLTKPPESKAANLTVGNLGEIPF